MVKPAADISAKQIRRATAAAGDYAAGVQAPSVDWKAATLKADPKRKANLEAAEREGRWAKRVQQLSTADWQSKAATIGAERYAPGITAAADKVQGFWNIQQPKLDTLQKTVKAMPDATEEQRKARLLANFEGMKKTGY